MIIGSRELKGMINLIFFVFEVKVYIQFFFLQQFIVQWERLKILVYYGKGYDKRMYGVRDKNLERYIQFSL